MPEFNCKWDGTKIVFVLNQDQTVIIRARFAGTSVRRAMVKREEEQIQHWRSCGGDIDDGGVHLPGDSVGETRMDSPATYQVAPEFQFRTCPPDSAGNHMGFTEAFEGPGFDHTDTTGKQIFVRTFAIIGPLLSDTVSITIVMEDNTGGV